MNTRRYLIRLSDKDSECYHVDMDHVTANQDKATLYLTREEAREVRRQVIIDHALNGEPDNVLVGKAKIEIVPVFIQVFWIERGAPAIR